MTSHTRAYRIRTRAVSAFFAVIVLAASGHLSRASESPILSPASGAAVASPGEHDTTPDGSTEAAGDRSTHCFVDRSSGADSDFIRTHASSLSASGVGRATYAPSMRSQAQSSPAAAHADIGRPAITAEHLGARRCATPPAAPTRKAPYRSPAAATHDGLSVPTASTPSGPETVWSGSCGTTGVVDTRCMHPRGVPG